jgi:gluconate kinase
MKKILILFGEMGAGKNYWGEKLANNLGYDFFDGDTVVTVEMQNKVSQFKPIARGIIVDYLFALSGAIIDKAVSCKEGLVVSQALYNDQDRILLKEALEFNPDNKVVFYWVQPTFTSNLKHIFSREKGFRWVLYWLMNKPWFQKPTHDYISIG